MASRQLHACLQPTQVLCILRPDDTALGHSSDMDQDVVTSPKEGGYCLQDGGAIAQPDMHALEADGELGADGSESPQRQGGGVVVQQQRGSQAPQLLAGLLLLDDPLLLQSAATVYECLLLLQKIEVNITGCPSTVLQSFRLMHAGEANEPAAINVT